MKNIYKDSFESTFGSTEHSELIDALGEFSDAAVWESVPAAEVTFIPLKDVDADSLTLGDGDTLSDSMMSEMPVAVHLDDGRIYTIRPYLFKNCKTQFKDDAGILSDMLAAGRVDVFCDHLNMSKQFLKKKKIQMMLRGEKISGWFSDFNHGWSQLRQVEFMDDELQRRFPGLTFGSGCINHYYTEVRWALDESVTSKALCDDDTVVGAYLDAWAAAGGDREALKNAVPILRFNTGESGLYAITASPMLELPRGERIFLGTALSCNHRGRDSVVWDRFIKYPDNIATMYVQGMKGLSKLCETMLYHPYSACTWALRQFRSCIPAKALREVAEDVELIYGGEDSTSTAFAIEIFNCINAKVQASIKESKSTLKAFQNQELLARLVNADWTEFDKPRPAKFLGGDTSPELDFIAL